MAKYFTLRSLLVLLGLLGIVAYVLAPRRESVNTLLPSHDDIPFYVYDDSSTGGKSRAYLSHSDTLVLFDFSLGNDPKRSAFCAFGWDIESKGRRNWSFMDSLVLDVRATGTDQIIVKILTHDPDHTRKGESQTLRPLLKEVAVSAEWKRVAIAVEDLYTPDYWYDDNQIKGRNDTKHLESVVRVEVAPGWNAPRGKPLGVQLRLVEARGSSNLYFGLLVGWILLLIIAAMGVRTNGNQE